MALLARVGNVLGGDAHICPSGLLDVRSHSLLPQAVRPLLFRLVSLPRDASMPATYFSTGQGTGPKPNDYASKRTQGISQDHTTTCPSLTFSSKKFSKSA